MIYFGFRNRNRTKKSTKQPNRTHEYWICSIQINLLICTMYKYLLTAAMIAKVSCDQSQIQCHQNPKWDRFGFCSKLQKCTWKEKRNEKTWLEAPRWLFEMNIIMNVSNLISKWFDELVRNVLSCTHCAHILHLWLLKVISYHTETMGEKNKKKKKNQHQTRHLDIIRLNQ